MEVEEQRAPRADAATAPSLSEDIRTLLAATAVDVCAGTGVPFCSISRIKGDDAVLAAAQGDRVVSFGHAPEAQTEAAGEPDAQGAETTED